MNDKDFVLSERPESCGSPTSQAPRPHVLVADDDPGSCRFLGDGLRTLGATVETAGGGREALERAGAGIAPADRDDLLAAGFSDILLKPCTLTDLRRVLALVPAGSSSVLDDAAALCSSGDTTTMRALRLLLREELALLQGELDQLSADRVAFAERLHRLRSSCGFCGATALAEQAVRLQRQLLPDSATPAALASFRRVLRATLQALDS